MELVEKIDPAEVLAHLKQLGYSNITPAQLKEFMKDLKKLILYDQLSSSSDSLTSLSSSATSTLNSECLSSNNTSRMFSSSNTTQKSHHSRSSKEQTSLAKQPLHVRNATGTSGSNGGSLQRSSSSSSSMSEKGSITQKENQSHTCPRRLRTKSVTSEDIQEAIKPRTSFIRPWQLQGANTGQSRVGRSDPVSLYHYYQALWSRNKCPGEDSHADLRWVIRERMLGQDPHLYVPHQSMANHAKKHNRLRM